MTLTFLIIGSPTSFLLLLIDLILSIRGATLPYPVLGEVTRRGTARPQLDLGVLHVETVSVVLRQVPLYAGHVPTPTQPSEVGPECLTTNIAGDLPVDTISEAVVLTLLTRALCSVQLHVLDHLDRGWENITIANRVKFCSLLVYKSHYPVQLTSICIVTYPMYLSRSK